MKRTKTRPVEVLRIYLLTTLCTGLSVVICGLMDCDLAFLCVKNIEKKNVNDFVYFSLKKNLRNYVGAGNRSSQSPPSSPRRPRDRCRRIGKTNRIAQDIKVRYFYFKLKTFFGCFRAIAGRKYITLWKVLTASSSRPFFPLRV